MALARRSAANHSAVFGPAPSDASADSSTHSTTNLSTDSSTLRSIRHKMNQVADAVRAAADQLDAACLEAARRTARCEGSIIVTGVGKAGLVGQKLVATLASTGSPAHFLHPAEAVHGDLGRIGRRDVVWALSNSGRSDEVVRIIPSCRRQSAGLIAITAGPGNPLADAADVQVAIGRHGEIDADGLAPTCSTSVMLAVGDAIAITASELRGFTADQFATFHPGGALGWKLRRADETMRGLDQCRLAKPDDTVREAVTTSIRSADDPPRDRTRRCTGAVMIADRSGRLMGVFTDSDLVRLLAGGPENFLDQPIAEHMTSPCWSIRCDALLPAVAELMRRHRISELPVVDADGVAVGLIDRTDLKLRDDRSPAATAPAPAPAPSGGRLSVFRCEDSPPENAS